MGVQGLWQLIQSTGRPVTLESLEGKVLAVDVSIWLNQSMKGMRDKFGNPLPNAHLLSLYHRICKLLYYRIKPVFVFDGSVPLLKKQTLAARRQRRLVASESSNVAAKKLLSTILKQHAVSTVVGTKTGQKDVNGIPRISTIQGKAGTSKEESLYALPPLPEPDKAECSDEEELDFSYEERIAQRELIYDEYEDLEEVDVDSQDFKTLPPEVKHEILTDIKDSRKRTHWANIEKLPKDSQDFSNYQIAKLMKQNKLSKKIENVRQEMTQKNTGDIAASVSSNTENTVVESRRVVSEDTSHYILIKGLSKLKEHEKPVVEIDSKYADDIDAEMLFAKDQSADSGTDDEHLLAKRKCKVVRFSEMEPIKETEIETNASGRTVCSNSDVNIVEDDGQSVWSQSTSQMLTREGNSKSTTDEDRVIVVIDDKPEVPDSHIMLGEYEGGFVRDEESDSDSPVPMQQITSKELNTEMLLKQSDMLAEKSSYFLEENILVSPPRLSNALNPAKGPALEIQSLKRNADNEILDKTPDKITKLDTVIQQREDKSDKPASAQTSLNAETGEQSDEDDFIEVAFDMRNIQPDEELFPASIFETPVISTEKKETVQVTSVDKLDQPSEETETFTEPDVERLEEPAAIMDVDDSPEPQKVESVSDEFVADQFNEFDGMTKEELSDLQYVLEAESQQLQEERGKQERLAATVSDQMNLECQELLKLFGIPYLVSPMEAEAQCAFLDLTGLTSGSITDDSDIWLFGGQRVYKNFFNQTKNVEFYKFDDIQRQMVLSRRKLINLALLCGSDYTVGIQGVGGVTALEIMTEFPGGEEQVLNNFKKWWDKNHDKVKIPNETKVKTTLRKLQLHQGFPSTAVVEAYLKPTIDESEEKFTWNTPDLDYLREFASSKFGWTRSKVDESLLPMMKQLNQSSAQSHITSFFSVEFQDAKKPKSTRVKRVLNRMRTDNALEENSSTLNGKGKGSRKGKQLCKKGNISKTKITSEAAGSGWVQVPTVSKTMSVRESIELSEHSDSDSGGDDMFNDPEGDEILKNINLDLCDTQSSNVAPCSEKIVSNKGKGRGKEKNKVCVPIRKTVTLKSSLDKDSRRKTRGRQQKRKQVIEPSHVVLSESGSSSD